MSELSVVDRSEINEYDRLANYGTTVNRKIQISTVARSPHYKREAKVRNSPRLSSRISATCYGHSRVPGQVTMLTDDPCFGRAQTNQPAACLLSLLAVICLL